MPNTDSLGVTSMLDLRTEKHARRGICFGATARKAKEYNRMAQPTSRSQLPLSALVALALLFTGLIASAPPARAAGSIPLTPGPYVQTFDTFLASSGTSSSVPVGWDFVETGTSANTTYAAGTGSNNAGNTYSFGTGASIERAFGTLQSGTLISTIGASFTNNTSLTITDLAIGYTGEQWRLGALGRADRLDFQLSTNAISLTNGVWTDYDSLDFTSPITNTAVGALDGNAAANRTPLNPTISGLHIPNGATFWIRWVDFDAAGSDDGLAVDSFSITAGTNNTAPSGVGAANPGTVLAGNATLLTVAVTSGANPSSTGISVAGDLSAIGGAATQAFFDNGTNGDATAGDNTLLQPQPWASRVCRSALPMRKRAALPPQSA
jgi:hypothetical protein